MEEKNKKDLELIRNEFNTIVSYEKIWLKVVKRECDLPVAKIINHFGAENVCNIFGCTIVSHPIAMELIKEAFK